MTAAEATAAVTAKLNDVPAQIEARQKLSRFQAETALLVSLLPQGYEPLAALKLIDETRSELAVFAATAQENTNVKTVGKADKDAVRKLSFGAGETLKVRTSLAVSLAATAIYIRKANLEGFGLVAKRETSPNIVAIIDEKLTKFASVK